jgi:AraC family transcriptional regulator
MRYVRGRRLTEAARSLAAGEPNILKVALEAGYGSHEAFTRAFREQFQVTPEGFRSAGSLSHIQLVEPIRLDRSMLIQLDPPRFEENDRLLIAGLSSRYTFETSEGIPRQWQRFAPYIGNLAGQIGPETYGVSHNFDDSGSFEYIAGVQVSHLAAPPDGFETVCIGRQRYAVFQHGQHVSMLRRTHYSIWNKWLPDSGKLTADAPNFERYGKQFDPVAGIGPIELWVPVEN